MCFTKGNDQAAQEQQRAQEEEARRSAGIARVNQLFGVVPGGGQPTGIAARNASQRQMLMDKLFGDTNAFYRNDINRQSDIAKRNLKFNLARTGNLGGSVDVDKNALLTDTRNRALLDAGTRADQARQNAENADSQTRLDLIRQINAGVDTDAALAGANTSLRQNIADAGFNARTTSLGDAFSQLADVLPYSSLSATDPSANPYQRRSRYSAPADTGVYTRG